MTQKLSKVDDAKIKERMITPNGVPTFKQERKEQGQKEKN